MEAAKVLLETLCLPWSALGHLPVELRSAIQWVRAVLSCVAEQVDQPPTVLSRGQQQTIALPTLCRAVDDALAVTSSKKEELTCCRLLHWIAR
jgi:hypothetical protein